jgi:hypothetical protein
LERNEKNLTTLWQLLLSPIAVARVLTASLTILYAVHAGLWFSAALLANLTVVYTGAFGIALIARMGGDPVFTRHLSLSTAPAVVIGKYVGTSILRLPLAILPVAYLAFEYFTVDAFGILGMIVLAIAMVVGNALRIAVSPNYQIGFDNSCFNATVLTVTILSPIHLDIAIFAYAVGLLIVYGTGYVRQVGLQLTSASLFKFSSKYYLASEMSYFALAYTTPALLVLTSGREIAGVIRSVEQVVFSGTFILFLINNRLFHDLSRSDGRLKHFLSYLKQYSIPALLFYMTVTVGIVLAAVLGFIPNIVAMPTAFILYSLGYFVSVSCGPASGYLNFEGHERFVTLSVMIGVIPLSFFAVLGLLFENGLLLVFGSMLGIIVANTLQFWRLYVMLRAN